MRQFMRAHGSETFHLFDSLFTLADWAARNIAKLQSVCRHRSLVVVGEQEKSVKSLNFNLSHGKAQPSSTYGPMCTELNGKTLIFHSKNGFSVDLAGNYRA
jgi:hypothetical protein